MSCSDPFVQVFDWHFTTLPNLARTLTLTMKCGEVKEGAPTGFLLITDVFYPEKDMLLSKRKNGKVNILIYKILKDKKTTKTSKW